jgi:hypothetical protein
MAQHNSGWTRSHINQGDYELAAPGQEHNFGSLGLFACNDRAWDRIAKKAAKSGDGGKVGEATVTKLEDAKTPSQKLHFVQGRVAKMTVKQARKQLGAGATGLSDQALIVALTEGVVNLTRTRGVSDYNLKGYEKRVMRVLMPEGLRKSDDGSVSYYQADLLLKALKAKKNGGLDGFGVKVCVLGDVGYYETTDAWKPRLYATDKGSVLEALGKRFDEVTKSGTANQAAEKKVLQAARRTLSVQGMDHGNTTRFLLAVAITHMSMPTYEGFKADKVSWINTARFLEEKFDDVVKRDEDAREVTIDEPKLLAKIADMNPDAAGEMLGDLMLDAIVDPRPAEYFKGLTGRFLAMLAPGKEHG